MCFDTRLSIYSLLLTTAFHHHKPTDCWSHHVWEVVGRLFINFCSVFFLMRHGCGVLSLSEHVLIRSDNLETFCSRGMVPMNSRNIVLPVSGSMYIYASMGNGGRCLIDGHVNTYFPFRGRSGPVGPRLRVCQRRADGNKDEEETQLFVYSCLSQAILKKLLPRVLWTKPPVKIDPLMALGRTRHALFSGAYGNLRFLNSSSVRRK